jgi:hypothetical protein
MLKRRVKTCGGATKRKMKGGTDQTYVKLKDERGEALLKPKLKIGRLGTTYKQQNAGQTAAN